MAGEGCGATCGLGSCPLFPEASIYNLFSVCFPLLCFSVLQKKAEAAHRILEGLGPQVELVSWGGAGSWRGREQVGEQGEEVQEVRSGQGTGSNTPSW